MRKKSVVPIYVFAGVWFLYAMIGKLYTLPQLLIAAGLSGVSSLALIPYLFYPFLLAIFVLISIARAK